MGAASDHLEDHVTAGSRAEPKPFMARVNTHEAQDRRIVESSLFGTVFANAVEECGGGLDLAKEDLTLRAEKGCSLPHPGSAAAENCGRAERATTGACRRGRE